MQPAGGQEAPSAGRRSASVPHLASEGQPGTRAHGWILSQALGPRQQDHGDGTRGGWLATRRQSLAGRFRSLGQRRRIFIGLVPGSFALASMAVMLSIYLRSWWVLVNQHVAPCDVPLGRILCVLLILAPIFQARKRICRTLHRVCRWHLEPHDGLVCQATILGLVCMGLAYYATVKGMNQVDQSVTCHRTAPFLYDWAAYIFPAGVLHFVVLQTLALVSGALYAEIVGGISQGSKGLDRAAVMLLDTVQPSPGAMCSICLEAYAVEAAAKVMPCCGNCFHAECLEGWLGSHRTCPLCRTELQRARRACLGSRLFGRA